LLGSLNSSEYMHCRTALIVLSRLVQVYPSKSTTGTRLLSALAKFQADDYVMQDLKAMAQGYHTKLIKARDDGVWKEEDSVTLLARITREKEFQEQRRKNVERAVEEMKMESEQMSKSVTDRSRRIQVGTTLTSANKSTFILHLWIQLSS